MIKSTINRTKTAYFSSLANDLVYNQERLADFIEPLIDVHSFRTQIEKKKLSYSIETRTTLVSHFKAQYKDVDSSEIAFSQISKLEKETTFTVTTGHQLNIFTGPLFFIYKLVHTINLSRKLKESYPDFDFVPVYWMASEDHDFEEINHLNLFGQKVEWKTTQKGAVGKFVCTGFDEVKNALQDKFERDEYIKGLINKHYLAGQTLAQATFNFVNELFGAEGLLILDADNSLLKKCFSPYIKKELQTSFSESAVAEQSDRLEEKGYKSQVHPRAINLFYLAENSRERIIKSNEGFVIGNQSYSLEELTERATVNPEYFSPNVVLRPLYQEVVLPNLCYIGGGGEIAYWTQLKTVFEKSAVPFPLLMIRNSVQLIDSGTQKKLKKLDLTVTDFFGDLEQLKKQYVLEHPETNLDFEAMDNVAAELAEKMEALITEVDPNMITYAKSESTRLTKQLEQVKSKMIRHQKKKMEDTMLQIDAVYDKLFPNGGLQERNDNVLQWMSIIGKDLILQLLKRMDAFDKDFILLEV